MSRRFRVVQGDHEIVADLSADGRVTVDGQTFTVQAGASGHYRVVDAQGRSTRVAVAGPAHAPWLGAEGAVHQVEVDDRPKRAGSQRGPASDMTAPMPATVVKVLVAPGDRVSSGDAVVVLEAMKMELTVRAGRDGVVREVRCAVGDLVSPGVPLAEIDA